MSKKRKVNNKAKLIAISVVSALLLIIAGGAGGYKYYNIKNTNKTYEGIIYPGVTIGDVDLSSKTKEEAVNLLKAKYGEGILKKKINIVTDKKTYPLEYSKLNARYDIEDKVNEAFLYGKDLPMLEKYKLINEGAIKRYDLSFTYDNNYVGQLLSVVEKDVNKEPVNASIKAAARGSFDITSDIKGYKLDKEKLEGEINSKINGDLTGDTSIKAPIQELTAAITPEKLKSIDTNIATYNTSYASSSAERSNNIELATKAINGKVLMPGDTFSFNDTVGQRTRERGYKEAGVIINNQISSDLGGGICQVSSTLYNALLRTDLDYKGMERIAHSIPSSYVPKGLDATVDWGNIDYKFKNTLDYPIYIEGYVQNKIAYFNIYSNSVYKNKTYTFTNDIIQTVPTTTTTVEDPSLPEGQQVKVKESYQGYKVKVTKNTFTSGALSKTEELYTDYYRPITGQIKVGTKKIQ
jgi:vancomycin resistance protein YoaR